MTLHALKRNGPPLALTAVALLAAASPAFAQTTNFADGQRKRRHAAS